VTADGVQSAATFVDKLIAGLREQLPHNSEGRATCPRCKQVIPEEDALCWPCADAARQAEAHADARKAIADGTRALMASLPPWPYADVRNPEWCSGFTRAAWALRSGGRRSAVR
jgi:hypothetical protein